MPLTQSVLKRLAVPLNRGDFPTFVEVVERLPAADRNVLAVLGASDLMGRGTAREYLSQGTETKLMMWAEQFKGTNVDELADWPDAPGEGV